MVLFLLEDFGILSPDLDFFDASGSRDSSNFFRALEKTGRKVSIDSSGSERRLQLESSAFFSILSKVLTCPSSSTCSVDVCFHVRRHIIVDNIFQAINMYPSSHYISTN